MDVPGVAWMAITEADLRDNSSMYLVNPSPQLGRATGSNRGSRRRRRSGHCRHRHACRIIPPGACCWSATEPGRLDRIERDYQFESSSLKLRTLPGFTQATRRGIGGAAASVADGKPAFTTETMKYLRRFRGQIGFPVHAGRCRLVRSQRHHEDERARRCSRTGALCRAKNVKVWIWLHYKRVDAQMEEAFPLYEKWGVAGLKIDFIERDDQGGIDFYYRAAQEAARHHLMVDFHGATKPTGMERTYPEHARLRGRARHGTDRGRHARQSRCIA